jgi:hypothetical protein
LIGERKISVSIILRLSAGVPFERVAKGGSALIRSFAEPPLPCRYACMRNATGWLDGRNSGAGMACVVAGVLLTGDWVVALAY